MGVAQGVVTDIVLNGRMKRKEKKFRKVSAQRAQDMGDRDGPTRMSLGQSRPLAKGAGSAPFKVQAACTFFRPVNITTKVSHDLLCPLHPSALGLFDVNMASASIRGLARSGRLLHRQWATHVTRASCLPNESNPAHLVGTQRRTGLGHSQKRAFHGTGTRGDAVNPQSKSAGFPAHVDKYNDFCMYSLNGRSK